MDIPVGKIPPHNAEAEQAVLGSMLLDERALPTVFERLKAEDFYIPRHKLIYESMMELFSTDSPVDIVTVRTGLAAHLDAVGGVDYLLQLADIVPSMGSLKYYVDIVESKSLLRKLIQAGGDIMSMSYDESEEISTVVDAAEQKIFDILASRNTRGFTLIRDIMLESLRSIEEFRRRGNKIVGIATGFTELDEMTAGLQGSDLIMIAARPGMGKTSFAINIAQYAATRHDVPVAIFNLEMSKEQLLNRMLWSEAGIDGQKLRTGDLSKGEMGNLARAVEVLSPAPIYIDDTPGITAAELRAKCRRLKLEKRLGLVVIDYLQLMQGSGRKENRQQEVSDISRSLKILAKELSVPVVTLSQLSRASETHKRPILSDLRESGAIEQDADIVMFLYRDYYNEEPEMEGIAECIIAKHRNGSTGTIQLRWIGEHTKFANLERHYE